MTIEYVFFLIIGRMIIYAFEKFVRNNEIKIKFIQKLSYCLLCSGVWVYSLLAFAFTYSAFPEWKYVQFFSEFVTGVFSAVLVFYFDMGYRTAHEVVVIE